MNWYGKVRLILFSVLVLALLALGLYAARLSTANGRLRYNQDVLLAERETAMIESCRYRTSDSLNAAKVTELRLTLAEYRKYRKKDLEEIKKLKIRQGDLEKIIKTQASTVQELTARLADTVTPAGDTLRCFDYRSQWTDIAGCVGGDTVSLSVENREALKVIETVRYKRFLGFLWKTKKVKARQVDIVSENPATTIVSLDVVSIER